jgi:flagellar protein FliT
MSATQDRFLECYAEIAAATSRMLAAARAADWQALDDSKRECNEWIARIERLGDPGPLLDGHGRRVRLDLLRRVLRDDAAIRELLQPWLGQVDRCLGGPRPSARA